MPKTSHVWFFFDKKSNSVEDKQVVCSICNKSINYTMNCSTGSLRSHLVRSHNLTDNNYKKHKMYHSKLTPGEEYNSDEDNATTNDAANAINNDKNNYFINCLVDFILCTDQAFSILDDQEFINLLRALNRKFKVPTRKTFTDSILHNKVKNIKS